jgi:hypothetical protein
MRWRSTRWKGKLIWALVHRWIETFEEVGVQACDASGALRRESPCRECKYGELHVTNSGENRRVRSTFFVKVLLPTTVGLDPPASFVDLPRPSFPEALEL